MRQIFTIAILSLTIILSCGSGESNQTEQSTKLNLTDTLTEQVLPDGIEISIDTLKISMNGRLRKVALFKDNFYCMFESGRENTSRSFKKMIVVDKEGDFIEDVFIPEGIQDMNYYDILIENDSLFLKRTQFDEETFLLGKYVADFKQIERRNFSIYQDSSYKVFATCNGEWGGTIFFKDLTRRPTKFKHKICSNRMLTNGATNTICTKIFFVHNLVFFRNRYSTPYVDGLLSFEYIMYSQNRSTTLSCQHCHHYTAN